MSKIGKDLIAELNAELENVPVAPLDLAQMQTEVHALAYAKGWYEDRDLNDQDVRESMLALIHSEISEALECVRQGQLTAAYDAAALAQVCCDERDISTVKPEGLPSELADIVIRTLDYCAAFNVPTPTRRLPTAGETPGCTPTEAGAVISGMHRKCAALDFETLVAVCFALAFVYGIDLDAAIREKHAFNATRPHRHGGKAL